jgi:hydrogenase expression/formation protein HypC
MCLAIPAQVIDVFERDGVLHGRVDFGGVTKQVCLDHVRDVVAGEYVLVHVGFALQKIDEDEARRTFALLAELGQLDELDVGPA